MRVSERERERKSLYGIKLSHNVASVIYFEKLATIRQELLFGLRKDEQRYELITMNLIIEIITRNHNNDDNDDDDER